MNSDSGYDWKIKASRLQRKQAKETASVEQFANHDLAADFTLDDDGNYRVFIYSDVDEIQPFLVAIAPGRLWTIEGATITFMMLQPFHSGRLLQEADGCFSVRENVPRDDV